MALGRKRADDSDKEVFLNITPMVDILCSLLFFLMLSYKSQSLMLEGAKGIQLPPSTSDKGLVVSLTVTVTASEIKLMDSHVMALKNGEVPAADLQGSKIVPLYNRMSRLVQLKNMDSEKSFVLLLADKRLKSGLLTKVLKTCGMAGMPNFHLGVASM